MTVLEAIEARQSRQDHLDGRVGIDDLTARIERLEALTAAVMMLLARTGGESSQDGSATVAHLPHKGLAVHRARCAAQTARPS